MIENEEKLTFDTILKTHYIIPVLFMKIIEREDTKLSKTLQVKRVRKCHIDRNVLRLERLDACSTVHYQNRQTIIMQ